MSDFQQRKFQKPAVRLIKTSARTRGSYTFEVFAFEEKKIRQFNIRFLPDKPYYVVQFVKAENGLQAEDEGVLKVAETMKEVYFRFHDKWEGKKTIEELSYSFISILINSQNVEIPKEILGQIEAEIKRIFLNPDIVKSDKKGRPYFGNAQFGNAQFGKFFITDLGFLSPADYERYNIAAN